MSPMLCRRLLFRSEYFPKQPRTKVLYDLDDVLELVEAQMKSLLIDPLVV